MDREFERFRGGANEALSKRLHVTISPANLILLNRNVYNLFGKPAAVYLNYSRERDSLECGRRRLSAFDNVMHFEKLDVRRTDT